MDTVHPTAYDHNTLTEYDLWCDLMSYAGATRNETLRHILQMARPHWHYVQRRTGTAVRTQSAGRPLTAPPRDEKPQEDKVYGPPDLARLQRLTARNAVLHFDGGSLVMITADRFSANVNFSLYHRFIRCVKSYLGME